MPQLENEWMIVDLSEIGASIIRWTLKKPAGFQNIVLTNAHGSDYESPLFGYLGATLGRVAGRIRGGEFVLNGVTHSLDRNYEEGRNCGHGGYSGLSFVRFAYRKVGDQKVVFSHQSPDKTSGFPGNVAIEVFYHLLGKTLRIEYHAISDQDTILNLSNHAYFSLSNEQTVDNHGLLVPGTSFLETDDANIPTGNVVSITSLGLDPHREVLLKEVFRRMKKTKIPGLDHNILIENNGELRLRAKDVLLSMKTSYPSVVLYTANEPTHQPLEGRGLFSNHSGIAIEPMFPVDAIHRENDCTLLRQGECYHHFIEYRLDW